MLKYIMTATALKAFSSSTPTKNVYRLLGNTVGARKRIVGRMPSYYVDRVNRILRLNRNYGIFVKKKKIIELGTGWLHWDAIILRLFFDVEGVLFDIWDNRQLGGVKNYLSQLYTSLDRLEAEPEQLARAKGLISEILKVDNYEQLYNLLGFEYVVAKDGELTQFPNNSFDIVVSSGVLEHIPVEILRGYISGIASILTPGGYSIHSINIRDHLQAYDRCVSSKQYLKYSDRIWRCLFENEVQYFNRVQRSQWLDLFEETGLVLLEEDRQMEELSIKKMAKKYYEFSETDHSCVGLKLLHYKPILN